MVKNKKQKIQELYDKLMNESEVARELGVSRQSMYDYRIRHGIKYSSKRAKEKTYLIRYHDRNKKIIDAYMSNINMDKICSRFGMNLPAINYILSRYGVKKPSISKAFKRNMEILKSRMGGTSVKELAERYNLNPLYVSTMIYKMKQKENIKKGI